MSQLAIQRPFGELDWATSCGLIHTQFFISFLGQNPKRSFLFWQMKSALSHECNLFRVRCDTFNRIDVVGRMPREDNRW